jgi:DNA-binding MarR family transcriptional regulator
VSLVNVGISCGEVLKVLCRLSVEKLTYKQKLVLKEISDSSQTITSLVKCLSKRIGCSKSTLWSSVKQLVYFGLIVCKRGKPCKLTNTGSLIIKEVI